MKTPFEQELSDAHQSGFEAGYSQAQTEYHNAMVALRLALNESIKRLELFKDTLTPYQLQRLKIAKEVLIKYTPISDCLR